MLAVRPHFLADSNLLFSINNYRVHLSIIPRTAWQTLRDGLWIHPTLFPLAVLLALYTLAVPALRRQPLVGAAILGALGYMTFIGYHTNFQPRYYLVLEPAVVLLITLATHHVATHHTTRPHPASPDRARNPRLPPSPPCCFKWPPPPPATPSTPNTPSPPPPPPSPASPQPTPPSRPSSSEPSATTSPSSPAFPPSAPPTAPCPWPPSPPGTTPGWYLAHIDADSDTRSTLELAQLYTLDERARFETFDDPTRHTLVLYRLIPR